MGADMAMVLGLGLDGIIRQGVVVALSIVAVLSTRQGVAVTLSSVAVQSVPSAWLVAARPI